MLPFFVARHKTPQAEIKTPHAGMANAARGDDQRRTRGFKRRLRRIKKARPCFCA